MRSARKILSLILVLALLAALGIPALAADNEDKYGEYEEVGDFYHGYAPAKKGDWWGVIDESGNEILPCKYQLTYVFEEVALFEVFQNNMAGLFDPQGNQIVPFKYTMIYIFSQGMATVQLNGKFGYINTKGEEVIPPIYADAYAFEDVGLAKVIRFGKCGFVDTQGNEVVPLEYQELYAFANGFAVAAREGKYGYVNTKGEEAIPCQYDFAYAFEDCGLAPVLQGDMFGLINTSGSLVVPFEYTKEEIISLLDDYKSGKLPIPAPIDRVDPSRIAHASTQTVLLDGEKVEFQCYALWDAEGNPTNYIRLRDLAYYLNGTPAQFEVGWNWMVSITAKLPYTPNGSELTTPFTGDREFDTVDSDTLLNGSPVLLSAILLTDDDGGGYTYYKLRDLGMALNFNVGWTKEKGLFVETDKPYDRDN